MKILAQTAYRFFKVMFNGQAYLNLLYLLATFPLSVIYFVFLVSGLSLGVSLSIIWIGIPLLLVVGAGWWILASFERFVAIHWLKEDVTTMTVPPRDKNIWAFLNAYITNPVFWKSPIYLFLKFPLGIGTFVILVTLVSLTLAFLTLPLTFNLLDFQIGGFFSPNQMAWQIDSIGEAFLGTLVGLILWPLTMHLTNGLAWVHAKFARVMLSVNPIG